MAKTGRLQVMLTRSEAENQLWADALRSHGIDAYGVATFKRDPVQPSGEVLSGQYDWLVFTSAAGVENYNKMIGRTDGSFKVAAVGDQTASAARSAGLTVSFVPAEESGLALAAQLPEVTGKRILRVQGSLAGNAVSDRLRSRGAIVTDAVVYETKVLTSLDAAASQRLKTGGIDAIIFASPSGVRGFMQRIDKQAKKIAQGLPVVALGPSVAEALQAAGYGRVVAAGNPNLGGVIEALGQLTARL